MVVKTSLKYLLMDSKKYFLVIAFAFVSLLGYAQQDEDRPSDLDGFYEALDSLESFYASLDSFLEEAHYKPAPEEIDSTVLNVYGFRPHDVPTYDASVYSQRLMDLDTRIPLEYNRYVQAFIDVYVIKRREQMRNMLGLQHVFFPIYEEVFDREGLPMELKYLSVVESALNPHAVSRAGATGLWQFMYATGKQYGLKVTSHVDERRDPVKATEAAAKYFKNMYRVYKDWLLVIAAYNCGPGNVNKALKRGKGKRSFWEIREYLPRETRGYVPAFIAATYAFNYHKEHNLYPKPIDFTYEQDTIWFTRKKATLQQIADLTHTSYYELKDLNPELKTNTIPYCSTPFCIRVPHKAAEFFTLHRDSAYSYIAHTDPDSIIKRYKDSVLVSRITRKPYVGKKHNTVGDKEENLIYHTVRSGEVVGTIAEKYGVGASRIAQWNGLRNYRIKAGQRLKIYTSKKTQVASKKAEQNTVAVPKPKPEDLLKPNPSKQTFHTVKSGDTLWDIAQLYPGATIEKLKAMNHIRGSRLKIGQKLRVL